VKTDQPLQKIPSKLLTRQDGGTEVPRSAETNLGAAGTSGSLPCGQSLASETTFCPQFGIKENSSSRVFNRLQRKWFLESARATGWLQVGDGLSMLRGNR
jgi:hypothetical protein